jgi:hypothetical protein
MVATPFFTVLDLLFGLLRSCLLSTTEGSGGGDLLGYSFFVGDCLLLVFLGHVAVCNVGADPFVVEGGSGQIKLDGDEIRGKRQYRCYMRL